MIAIAKALVIGWLMLFTASCNTAVAADNTLFDNDRINYSPPNSFGIGFIFGGGGVSYDRALDQRFTLTAAYVNSILASKNVYSIGAKVFIHKGRIWQPRLTLLYGTNTTASTVTSCLFGYFCNRTYDTFDGFSFGIGQRFVLGSRGKHSLDFDFFYHLAPNDAKDFVAETDARFVDDSIMRVAFGYRYYY